MGAQLNNFTLVSAARDFAAEAHKGQVDKLKEPYYNHLVAVAHGVRLLGGSIPEIAAAFLHDVVEDVTKVTYATLLDEGFPPSVVRTVWAVTKKNGEEQEKYLKRVIAAGPSAMRVKTADLLHNLRADRLEQLPTYTRERLLKKYQPSLARLMMELGYLQTLEEQGSQLATDPIGSTSYSWSDYSSDYTSVVNVDPGQSVSTSSSFYASAELMPGDWIGGLSSPIKSATPTGAGDRVFTLEDGTVWPCTYKVARIRTWTKTCYQARQAKEPTWSPAQEAMTIKSGTTITTKVTQTGDKK